MVDYPLSVPLIISSSLSAPLGSYVNGLVDVQSFSILMAVILILAAIRMAFVLPAALFSFVGGQAGARFMSTRLQGRTIAFIFSSVLIIFSLRLLYQSLA